MDINDAVKILNERQHRGFSWRVAEWNKSFVVACVDDKDIVGVTFVYGLEAIAIAEAYERRDDRDPLVGVSAWRPEPPDRPGLWFRWKIGETIRSINVEIIHNDAGVKHLRGVTGMLWFGPVPTPKE